LFLWLGWDTTTLNPPHAHLAEYKIVSFVKGHGLSQATNPTLFLENESARRSRATTNSRTTDRVPHLGAGVPGRRGTLWVGAGSGHHVFVFVARVGRHDPQAAAVLKGHEFTRATNLAFFFENEAAREPTQSPPSSSCHKPT
jgi:hypothetical protein